MGFVCDDKNYRGLISANFVLHVSNSGLVMLTQEHCQGGVGSLPLNIDFPSISQLQQHLC